MSNIAEKPFIITRPTPQRLDIALIGKLDSTSMREVLETFERLAGSIERGVILYDMVHFALPSPGAMAIEFSRLPAMLRLIRRFRRAALLTDKQWLQRLSEWEGALIPGLDIKAFARNDREQAERWLEEGDEG